jgi:hypothetical protein
MSTDIQKLNKLSNINIYYFKYYQLIRAGLTNIIIFLILTLIVLYIYKTGIVPLFIITIATIILILYILITLSLKVYTYNYSDSNNMDEIVFPFTNK